MFRTIPFAIAGVLAVLADSASAQATFSEIDTDGSDDLSYEELVAEFGTRGADGLMRNDSDGDGLLSLQEILEGQTGGDGTDEEGNPATDGDVQYQDNDRGHGNDPDGFDEDNPGRGHGDDGVPGGGNGNGRGN